MSNIGKKPILLPRGVVADIDLNTIKITGAKGMLKTVFPSGIRVILKDNVITVLKQSEGSDLDKFWGLSRSLISNMVAGVTEGFEKKLELVGVGFRARVEDKDLILNVGFAVPVRLIAPDGLSLKVEENIITVSGANKQDVGDFASRVRRIRPPDPYKGKGIRFVGEYIRKKAGKAAAKTTTA